MAVGIDVRLAMLKYMYVSKALCEFVLVCTVKKLSSGTKIVKLDQNKSL